MGNPGLDGVDRKILFELSADSRQPLKELGKKVRCSPQRLEYRLRQLLAKKVILDFVTVIDYRKVGYTYFVLNYALKNITGEKKEKIISRLEDDKEISLLLKGEGNWDVSVGFLSRSLEEAREKAGRINSLFEQHIDYEDNYCHVGANHFPRLYFPTLQQTPWVEEEWASGEGGEETLNNADAKILSAIANDARASTIQIAKKAGLSVPTVRQRMRDLQERGVIRGFTFNLNPTLAEHHFVRIYIRRNYAHVGKPDEMMKYFRSEPAVYRLVKSMGKHDLICDVRVQNDAQLREIVRTIRDRFGSMIVSYVTFRVYGLKRFEFFPRA